MMRTIGDVILTDLLNGSVDSKSYESHEQTDNNTKLANIRQKMYIPPKEPKEENKLLKNKKGWLETAVTQVAGHLVSDVTDWVKQKIMGNIFGFSLTSLAMGAKDLLQGNVIKTGKSIAQYAREKENNKTRTPGKTSGNIYPNFEASNNLNKNSLGNIFSASTIANNL